jgi:hypothetical protein
MPGTGLSANQSKLDRLAIDLGILRNPSLPSIIDSCNPMTRKRLKQTIPGLPRKTQRRLLSKELDLLLLTGCSCLLTLLHHPISEAIQAQSPARNAPMEASTQTGQQNVKLAGQFSVTMPPERKKLKVVKEG